LVILRLLHSSLKKNHNFRSDCIAQGVLIQFGDNAIFAWNTAIAITLYITTVHEKSIDASEKFFHICGWGWACFSTFLPFAISGVEVYDKAGVWCWFPHKHFIYRMILFYAPFLLQVLVISFCYFFVIKKLRNNSKEARSNGSKDKRVILEVYPIIFFVCYLFPTINRLYEAATSSENFTLFVLHSIFASSIGLVNSIAYGFDEKVQDLWEKYCFCCQKRPGSPRSSRSPIPRQEDIQTDSTQDTGDSKKIDGLVSVNEIEVSDHQSEH